MSDADEDDYMSEAVLALCEDKRPGLVHNRTKARQYTLEALSRQKNAQNKTVSKKALEQQNRTSGLETALGPDNKGFALLSKMGYKPGMGIGKHDNKGRVEPISIDVKKDRGCLGKDTAARQRQAEMASMRARMVHRRQAMEGKLKVDFSQRMRERIEGREIQKDLKQSQRICHQLDESKNIIQPEYSWFWPEALRLDNPDNSDYDDELLYNNAATSEETEEYDEEDAEEDWEPRDQLELITQYLRTQHLYCLWCGTTYADDRDMKENCPGITATDHR